MPLGFVLNDSSHDPNDLKDRRHRCNAASSVYLLLTRTRPVADPAGLTERAAAQAANAAITSNTSSTDDDSQLDAPAVSKKGKPPSDEEDYDPERKTKKKAVKPHFLINSSFVPSIFDSLPLEIRQMVIDDISDPLSLVSLSLVSKGWYSVLHLGKEAEKMWERRCREMGQTRRVRGAKTWSLSYIRLMRKRCILCAMEYGSSCLYDVAVLVPSLPYWAKLCVSCSKLPGPLQVAALGFQHGRIPVHVMQTLLQTRGVVLEASIQAWLDSYEADKVAKIDTFRTLLADDIFAGDLLSQIIENLPLPPMPSSRERKLQQTARALLQAPSPTPEDIRTFIDRYTKTEETKSQVATLLQGMKLSSYGTKDPPIDEFALGWSTCYMDLLVDGQITLEHYGAFIQKRRQAAGLAVNLVRLAKPRSAVQRCIVGCSDFSILPCEQNRCEKHCEGPCAPHSR